MSCGVGSRLGSDPALLWLWQRPVALAPIRPLAWEPPYTVGLTLKKKTFPDSLAARGHVTEFRPVRSKGRSPDGASGKPWREDGSGRPARVTFLLTLLWVCARSYSHHLMTKRQQACEGRATAPILSSYSPTRTSALWSQGHMFL